MIALHEKHPEYGWDRNKGYPTAFHREALKKVGITSYHRKSFRLFDTQLELEF
jgi:ribonuclease HII